ncbi:hypothetical protein GCM10012286_62980 [Streptomyces lasiicapitis]|uniref:Uncharacterized protein n=2 Tax=Streptomyces lasiicapitis TaxID=1923961 RepID=A0ABQ2MLA5_9ACTN|nr:hypothetical protein GCM10012286_62980 [Streptomyces lasiicapitis]
MLCAQDDSPTGAVRAVADIWWTDGGSNKFNNVDLHLRTEKNDVNKKGAVCDLTAEVNKHGASSTLCQVAWLHGISSAGVTADATLIYDIKDDGVGEKRWDLGGSPALR